MIYTELTKKAMRIAFDAHYGQTDRGETPYICHPLHVADQMPDEQTTAVAILHDVLEDTALTAEDLREEGIPEDIIRIVGILTRDRRISYASYIDRIIESGSRDALIVKQADLLHNMDESRTVSGTLPKSLIRRYQEAKARIDEALRSEAPALEEQLAGTSA